MLYSRWLLGSEQSGCPWTQPPWVCHLCSVVDGLDNTLMELPFTHDHFFNCPLYSIISFNEGWFGYTPRELPFTHGHFFNGPFLSSFKPCPNYKRYNYTRIYIFYYCHHFLIQVNFHLRKSFNERSPVQCGS